jgi:hypothetical protein
MLETSTVDKNVALAFLANGLRQPSSGTLRAGPPNETANASHGTIPMLHLGKIPLK